jgi:hypothetical protein
VRLVAEQTYCKPRDRIKRLMARLICARFISSFILPDLLMSVIHSASSLTSTAKASVFDPNSQSEIFVKFGFQNQSYFNTINGMLFKLGRSESGAHRSIDVVEYEISSFHAEHRHR